MSWNNSKTLSCFILSVSLATTVIPAPKAVNKYCIEQNNLTMSNDSYVKVDGMQFFSASGKEKTPYEEAIDLFGVHSNFTKEESETYWNPIEKNATETGVNVFELF